MKIEGRTCVDYNNLSVFYVRAADVLVHAHTRRPAFCKSRSGNRTLSETLWASGTLYQDIKRISRPISMKGGVKPVDDWTTDRYAINTKPRLRSQFLVELATLKPSSSISVRFIR